jgi:hypothetical protein
MNQTYKVTDLNEDYSWRGSAFSPGEAAEKAVLHWAQSHSDWTETNCAVAVQPFISGVSGPAEHFHVRVEFVVHCQAEKLWREPQEEEKQEKKLGAAI